MAEGEEFFENADAGASHTEPVQANSVRKGGVAMLKGHPCKIVDFNTSKPGKHGSAKIKFVGIDIFTGGKHEEICGSTCNIDIPVVGRKEYQLVDVNDGYLSLMDDFGNCREDIKLPKEDEALAEQITKAVEAEDSMTICVMIAMGQEKVISAKVI